MGHTIVDMAGTRLGHSDSLDNLDVPFDVSTEHRTHSGFSQFSFLTNNTQSSLKSDAIASTVSSEQYLAYDIIPGPDIIDLEQQFSSISYRPPQASTAKQRSLYHPIDANRAPSPVEDMDGHGKGFPRPSSVVTSRSRVATRGQDTNPFDDPESMCSPGVSHQNSALLSVTSDSETTLVD